MNKKTDDFLNQYRALENLIALEYNLQDTDSAVSFLLRKPEFRDIREELDYCREVRNLLSHNPKVDQRYLVEPSEEMIRLLERTLNRIRNPLRARDVWVPKERVVCKTMEDLVRPTMVEMAQHSYTHIPIVKGGAVTGVFSENTLLSCLLDDDLAGIHNDLKFCDIAKYLSLDQDRAETYRFVGRNTLASEIEGIFANATKKNSRIGLLFVTDNGRPNGKLLGIISPWDMAGVD